MSKRLFSPVYVCTIVLFLINSISTAQSEIPQQILDWQKAAQDCTSKGQTVEAVGFYVKIIQYSPKADYAMQAQSGIAIAYLKANEVDNADIAVKTLLDNYADYPETAKCIRDVSTAYLSANQPAQSKQLCQMVLSKWPNCTDAILIQRNLAMAHVQLGEFSEAETETSKMLKNFSTSSELHKGVRKIAYCYFKANIPKKAKELCQMALSNWPDHSEAILTKRDLVIDHIRLGEYEEAELVTAQLIADYSNHSEIGNCIGRIASYYFAPKKPQKAKELCQLALSNWPNHSDKAKTLSILANALIKLGEINQASEVTANLIQEYSDRKEIGNYIQKAAYYCLGHGQPLKAKELYQMVLQNWPQTQDVVLAQAGLAAACLQLNDPASAEKATVALLSDYQGHKNFVSTVSWLAEQYYKNKNYSKSKDLYEYVMALNPDSNVRLQCHAGIGQVYVRLGNDTKVQEQIEMFLSQYKINRPEDAEACMFGIGEEYFLMAEETAKAGDMSQAKVNYEKALKVWQQFENANPKHNKPQYVYFSGLIHQYLNRHEQATAYFQQVLDKWPQYDRAWDAQAMLIECYKQLKADNKLVASEADAKIRSACQNILEKYPDSPAAATAFRQLESFNKEAK